VRKKSGKFGNEHTTAVMLPMMVVPQSVEARGLPALNGLQFHQEQVVCTIPVALLLKADKSARRFDKGNRT
jgi:hypothetical protein